MRLATAAVLVAVSAAPAVPTPSRTPSAPVSGSRAPCAHVRNEFSFEVEAPMARVAPQFAPVAERAWGDPHWKPEFVYPVPESDVEGAVFTVPHAHGPSVWVNTRFDVPAGRMQYVAVVPGVLVTVIEVRVAPVTPGRTHVDVTYARTALEPEANAHVKELGEADRKSGPEWRRGVETALGLEPTR